MYHKENARRLEDDDDDDEGRVEEQLNENEPDNQPSNHSSPTIQNTRYVIVFYSLMHYTLLLNFAF